LKSKTLYVRVLQRHWNAHLPCDPSRHYVFVTVRQVQLVGHIATPAEALVVVEDAAHQSGLGVAMPVEVDRRGTLVQAETLSGELEGQPFAVVLFAVLLFAAA
jgi:hypothetical protein